MRKIAEYTKGFKFNNELRQEFTIKFLCNPKADINSGVFTITDINGNERELGEWQREKINGRYYYDSQLFGYPKTHCIHSAKDAMEMQLNICFYKDLL